MNFSAETKYRWSIILWENKNVNLSKEICISIFCPHKALNLWTFMKDFKLLRFLHLLTSWGSKFWSLSHLIFKAITTSAEKTLNQCSYTLLLWCVCKTCICACTSPCNIKNKASSKQLNLYFSQFECVWKIYFVIQYFYLQSR